METTTICRGIYRDYIGIVGYILGLYRDDGKGNGSYYKTRLILNILHSYLR